MGNKPRQAATVILLRDAPEGVQTFLIRRHGQSGFMGGATVFPGGKVDPLDRDLSVWGRTPAQCAALLGIADPAQALALFVAAVRELHEEARVLLMRDASGDLPSAEVALALTARLDALRDGHRISAGAHHRLLVEYGLRPALDLLHPFARWITPKIEPRRFDTVFFAATMPTGQRAGIDGYESTAASWSLPSEPLEDNRRGGPTILPPPTLHTLLRLKKLKGDAQACVHALGEGGIGPTILPHFVPDTEMGPVICLPADPLHPDQEERPRSEGAPEKGIDRFALRDGRFAYLKS